MTKHDSVSQEGIMKATEFVKKFGWVKTKPVLSEALKYRLTDKFTYNTLEEQWELYVDDLKRLVESHELVEFFGSLDDAIQIYEYSKDMEILSYGGREIPTKQLGQAIADVEACQ